MAGPLDRPGRCSGVFLLETELSSEGSQGRKSFRILISGAKAEFKLVGGLILLRTFGLKYAL